MQRQKVIINAEASTTIAVQLACSSLVAGGTGLIMFYWLNSLGLAWTLMIILALASSVGAGLLTTANIVYGAFLLHLILVHLAEDKPTNARQSFWLWPLSPLFRALAPTKLKIDEIFQRERLANEYREQLLQQVRERAATEERNHLARDLHDSIKQQLFSMRMSAIAARTYIPVGVTKAQEALEDILRSGTEAQVEMQALLQQLRSAPLENMSLEEAVHTQAQALEYRSGVRIAVEIAALPANDRCPLHMQEAIFRIAQEAFANIARHARAQQVRYTQTQDEKTLKVTISDDGQGFDMQVARKGMGLANIQERVRILNGTARIESEVGKGTTLCVQIPLLLSSEAKNQQEQEEYQAQILVTRAQGGLQLCTTLGLFTIVALVTDLRLFVAMSSIEMKNIFTISIGICLLLMLYGLVSAHLAIVCLKQYRGERDNGLCSLSVQVHQGWLLFLRLFIFASWQIMPWVLYLVRGALWRETGWFFMLVAVVILTLLWLENQQVKRAQDRYYLLLSRNILGWEVRQRGRSFRLRIILYLCLGIALLVNKTLPFFVPVAPWQWWQDYVLFTFFFLCIEMVLNIRRLQPWRKLAKGVS